MIEAARSTAFTMSYTVSAATLAPAYPALDAVRDAAQAEAEKQGATIAQIQASLPAA